MRDYFTLANFRTALALGSVLTLMALPRIALAGFDLRLYLPATLAVTILAAGAAAAWSRAPGMAGLFAPPAEVYRGIGLALLAAALLIPVQVFVLDPISRSALATGRPEWVVLRFPRDPEGRIALLLWSAGFETVFFSAASVGFFARLTRRPALAVILSAVLRGLVAFRQVSLTGVDAAIPAMVLAPAVSTGIASFLFIRSGLFPAVAYSLLVTLHVFAASP